MIVGERVVIISPNQKFDIKIFLGYTLFAIPARCCILLAPSSLCTRVFLFTILPDIIPLKDNKKLILSYFQNSACGLRSIRTAIPKESFEILFLSVLFNSLNKKPARVRIVKRRSGYVTCIIH